VTANHAGKTASSKANVQVPATSQQGLFVMIIVMLAVMIVMNRKRFIKKSA
jgi:hypothetical protein